MADSLGSAISLSENKENDDILAFRNGVGGKNTEVGGNNRVGVDSSNENGYYNIRGDGNDSEVYGGQTSDNWGKEKMKNPKSEELAKASNEKLRKLSKEERIKMLKEYAKREPY